MRSLTIALLILMGSVCFSQTDSSTFTYEIKEPPAHFGEVSFQTGSEYPISNVFSFKVRQCGDCSIKENVKNIDPLEIRIAAERENGEHLDVESTTSSLISAVTGLDLGTKVTFYLKGKVSKNGESVRITLTCMGIKKIVDIILFPE